MKIKIVEEEPYSNSKRIKKEEEKKSKSIEERNEISKAQKLLSGRAFDPEIF